MGDWRGIKRVPTPRSFLPAVERPSNLSANQFALPSMEGHAHPLAKYLPHGFDFHEGEEHISYAGQPGNYQDEHYHRLVATHPLGTGTEEANRSSGGKMDAPPGHVSELNWTGEKTQGYQYPGEISWVNRTSRSPMSSSGITDAMHAFALQGGKSTIPVHSTDRSEAGDTWAKRVGPAHLRPPSFGEVENKYRYEGNEHEYQDEVENTGGWRPPAGTHPYERHAGTQFTGRPGERSQKPWDGSSQTLVTPADKHLDWAFYKQPERQKKEPF